MGGECSSTYLQRRRGRRERGQWWRPQGRSRASSWIPLAPRRTGRLCLVGLSMAPARCCEARNGTSLLRQPAAVANQTGRPAAWTSGGGAPPVAVALRWGTSRKRRTNGSGSAKRSSSWCFGPASGLRCGRESGRWAGLGPKILAGAGQGNGDRSRVGRCNAGCEL